MQFGIPRERVRVSDSALRLAKAVLDTTEGPVTIPKPDFFGYAELLPNARRTNTPDGMSCVLRSNPNNPTGEVRELFPGFGRLTVVDEAYMEFTDGEKSLIRADCFDIVVLRTFSKAYSMTRERAAYVVGPPNIIDALDVPDASPAARHQAARLIGSPQLPALRRDVAARRELLGEMLTAFGAEVRPSVTNFVMARLPDGRLADVLRARNVRTLPLDQEPGLDGRGYCRVAVPSYADLDALAGRLR